MITSSTGPDSLWRTNDITAGTATWVRIQIASPAALINFIAVEYSMDGNTVMLYGMDIFGNLEIWTSTNNGQTFDHWRTLQITSDEIMDLVVYDGSTIFAAVSDTTPASFGFLGTTRLGTDKQRLAGVMGVSIALQPGFDPDDPANSVVILGDANNNIYISVDAGATWGLPQSVAAVGLGNVYVAFDADFVNNGLIYFATSASSVGQAKLTGAAAGGIKALKDSNSDAATATSFTGIAVSPDNALYAIGGDVVTTPAYSDPAQLSGTIDLVGDTSANDVNGVAIAIRNIDNVVGTFVDTEPLTIDAATLTAVSSTIVSGTIYVSGAAATGSIDVVIFTAGFEMGEGVTIDADALLATVTLNPATVAPGAADLFRLLLNESLNEWETETRSGAMGAWVTEGSNYVWTVVSATTVYGLMDTLSGQVQNVTVVVPPAPAGETTANVSWDAMTGATGYTLIIPAGSTLTPTGATSAKISGLTNNTAYSVKVRVAVNMKFSSRWSDAAAFTTLEAIAVPNPEVPDQGLQNAPLLPSFVWEGVGNAVSYDFELSTDPAFATTLVSTSIAAPTTGYTYEGPELAYDLNHYWRVRAISATGTMSAWCTIQNFHTRTEEIPPPDIDITLDPPDVDITVTVDLPQPTVIVDVNVPDVEVIVTVTVEPPSIILDVPTVVTITEAGPVTHIIPLPDVDDPPTPVYIWVIVGIGAVLTIAVIVLIIRTRRVV
jgi:hypothetical protein